ncbi:recombinase family protein [Salmonella enterica]|nr:recombinase family protein [Salmonella enterica]EJO1639660.1 recombinase family protein [Salmonella enterica]
MSNRVYAYLRASTKEQDAQRAKQDLTDFAERHGLTIAATFTENESGATLARPELFRLLDIAQPGDVLLLEQIDRLSRLKVEDWQKLKATIQSKGIRVVSLDLPTSHTMATAAPDEFTGRMFDAINNMMIDILAATARKDYTDRKRRQRQGVDKAKDAGKYTGRKINEELHAQIVRLVENGLSQRETAKMLKCALSTVARAMKRHREEEKQG